MAAEDQCTTADKFRVETECVNQIAELQYSLTVPAEFSAKMTEKSVDLLDMFEAMKHGSVIWSGMRDRMALWRVRGALLDGGMITITLTFSFSELHVNLIDFT